MCHVIIALLFVGLTVGCAGRRPASVAELDPAGPAAPEATSWAQELPVPELDSGTSAPSAPSRKTGVSVQEGFSGPVGLDQAVALALERNPDLVDAAERMAQAEAMVRVAWSTYWPSLGADFSALRADAPSVYLFKKIDQREFDNQTDFNDPGRITNYEFGLGLRYDLYRGGQDAAAVGIARQNRILAGLGREAVRNELVAAVTYTFHDIISADELLAAERAAVETVQSQLKEARARLEAGSVLRDEVLSLEVRLADTESRLIAARNAGRLARAALASLLAMDTSRVEGLRCADVPPPGVPATFEVGLERARARSPAYRAAHQQVERARYEVDRAAAGFLPTVGLYARLYHDADTLEINRNDANWVMGADVKWAVFSGFAISARTRAAEAGHRRAEAVLRRASLDLERNVRSAYIQLEDARARRKVTEAAVASAEETLQLVSRRFEAGAVTVTRYLEAEQDRTRARVNAIRVRCHERRALADVARVLGWWAVDEQGGRN